MLWCPSGIVALNPFDGDETANTDLCHEAYVTAFPVLTGQDVVGDVVQILSQAATMGWHSGTGQEALCRIAKLRLCLRQHRDLDMECSAIAVTLIP